MTLYLTDNTTAAEIARAKASGFVHAVKYYPAGATTNSDSGVTALDARLPGARGDGEARRRAVAARRSDRPRRRHVRPRARVRRARCSRASCATSRRCRIVLEHITTREAAEFVAGAPANVAATITPQHLLCSRNALFAGGMRPHLYCLPILKRETHRAGAGRARRRRAARSSSSAPTRAPHARHTKETRLRLRGLLLRATRRSSSTPRRSRTPARSTGSRASRASSAPTSTACRATRDTVTLVREPWTRAGRLSVRRRHARAAARRRNGALARRRRPVDRDLARRGCYPTHPKPARPSPPVVQARGEESPGSTEQDAG